ncbi:MAG: GNAT family N-acetyltransferase [Anaerolineae bacterium]|nr:GNAT family N-acetyltransferase [Anaerolineae bacterium]
MNIRQAKFEDSAGIAHVQVDSYRTAYAGIFPQSYLEHFTYEEQTQDWRDLLSAEMTDVLYVAETDASEIVGYALGRPDPNEFPPYQSELVALHVRKTYQRQGIGRRLIAAVAAHLKQAGCTSLMLWTLAQNPSRGLYERLGGQLLGEKDWGGNEDFGVSVQEVAYGWTSIESLTTFEVKK